jgi:hypothetical protein
VIRILLSLALLKVDQRDHQHVAIRGDAPVLVNLGHGDRLDLLGVTFAECDHAGGAMWTTFDHGATGICSDVDFKWM